MAESRVTLFIGLLVAAIAGVQVGWFARAIADGPDGPKCYPPEVSKADGALIYWCDNIDTVVAIVPADPALSPAPTGDK